MALGYVFINIQLKTAGSLKGISALHSSFDLVSKYLRCREQVKECDHTTAAVQCLWRQ